MFCSSCGNTVAEGVRFCTTCGKPVVPLAPVASFQAAAPAPAFDPPLPPVASLQAAASPAFQIGGFGLAGMGERLGAAILDMIVVVIVFAVAGMATAARLGGVTDSGFSLDGMPAAVAIGITSVVGFLYFWLA